MRATVLIAACFTCLAARAAAIAPVLTLTDFYGRFNGHTAAAIGDVNDDGYPDIAVSDPYYYISAGTQYGRIYVHYGSASGPGVEPAWWYEGTINFGNIGFALTGGDVNGDGFSDLLVASHAQASQGIVYAFYGSATGLPFTPSWTVRPSDNPGSMGEDIAAVDVDHDGYDDVLVGSASCSRGQASEGCVHLYKGGPTGPATTAAWIAESDQAGANFGQFIANAGDVNHDGNDDVIVAAPSYDNGQADEGRVYVYHGSATGLPSAPNRILELDQAGASFGWTIAALGDVDGDTYADIAAGARFYDGTLTNEGGVFLFKGSASGLAASPSWQATSGQMGGEMGRVAGAGDFDGDGFRDLLAGAPGLDTGLFDVGSAFVYRGNGSTFSTTADYVATGTEQDGQLGSIVVGLGDTDLDGFPEIFAGEFAPRGFVYTTMTAHPAGTVASSGASGGWLTVEKTVYPEPNPSYLDFYWPASCAGDEDYAIFEGHLGDYTSHVPVACGTGQRTYGWTYMPSFDAYYLVVPVRLGREGSYGRRSSGVERAPSASACSPQEIASCP